MECRVCIETPEEALPVPVEVVGLHHVILLTTLCEICFLSQHHDNIISCSICCKRSDETEGSVRGGMFGILGFQSILPAWINDPFVIPGKAGVTCLLPTDVITVS